MGAWWSGISCFFSPSFGMGRRAPGCDASEFLSHGQLLHSARLPPGKACCSANRHQSETGLHQGGQEHRHHHQLHSRYIPSAAPRAAVGGAREGDVTAPGGRLCIRKNMYLGMYACRPSLAIVHPLRPTKTRPTAVHSDLHPSRFSHDDLLPNRVRAAGGRPHRRKKSTE